MTLPNFDFIYMITDVDVVKDDIFVELELLQFNPRTIVEKLHVDKNIFFEWVVYHERNVFARWPTEIDDEPEVADVVVSMDEYFTDVDINIDLIDYLIDRKMLLFNCENKRS